MSPETTFPALRAPLYSATALDLLAVELRSSTSSFSTAQTHARAFSANELFLYIGADEVKNDNSLFLRLDAAILSKISLLIRRLEWQTSIRDGKAPQLTRDISCRDSRWTFQSVGKGAMLWLSGNNSVNLRGMDKPLYLAQALAYDPAALTISFKESFTANTPGTLFDYYGNADGKSAITSCMGPEVVQSLEGAKPLLSFLKSSEVSAFTVTWIGLAGTIALMVD